MGAHPPQAPRGLGTPPAPASAPPPHMGELIYENQQLVSIFFKIKLFKEWMKKFVALLTKETVKIGWVNVDYGFLQALCSLYKKLGQLFLHTFIH